MIQAYNYLMGSFPVKRELMYPANKRSELRRVYNNIVDLSKHLPYYKINLSQGNQEYAFGVKESALEMKEKLKEIQNSQDSIFQNKSVSVSNESILSASLISQDTDNLPDTIQIRVDSLAGVQVNKGKDLLYDSYAFPQGKYNFNVTINQDTYPLTYIQKDRITNRESMQDIADFMNQSVPGITASVEAGEDKDYVNIAIAADMTERYGEKNFSFEDNEDFKVGLVDFFGLNRVQKAPEYARFELNGMDKKTATNTFTLENTLHITLLKTSDQPATLSITPDSEKILPMVDSVLSIYNHLLGLANDRTMNQKEHYSASKLIREMKNLSGFYENELSACGIQTMEDGTLKMDDSLAVQAAEDGGMESLFQRENGFIARLMDKADSIAINPMEYLEKTIVFYPDNNEKNMYRNPYVTSMYSGLFFNSYC